MGPRPIADKEAGKPDKVVRRTGGRAARERETWSGTRVVEVISIQSSGSKRDPNILQRASLMGLLKFRQS